MSRTVDAIVVGSGHNGLVAAAYLARAGWQVEVLERNPVPGGSVATEELTLPGFRHDTFSSFHTLFHLSAACSELGEELRERGLAYVDSEDAVAATVSGDGESVVLYRDPERTAAAFGEPGAARYLAELERTGAHMDLIGELMGTELHSRRAAVIAAKLSRRLGRRSALAFAGGLGSSARAWSAGLRSEAAATLLAPWVLHTGLAPDDAGGAFQLAAISGALHAVGLPVVEGGSSGFVRAFVALIEDAGGTVRSGVDVERIIVERGRSVGVGTSEGELRARRAVIANVTPTQLYGRLLSEGDAPAQARAEAAAYRYNTRAGMQIHLALEQPPRWSDPALGQVPLVHVSDGCDAISLSCAQASAGLLPSQPTIVCGQQGVLDPSRLPAGKGMLWIQLQELPPRPRGDAAGEIEVGDGSWTPALADAFADRVVERLARHVPNLAATIAGRAVLSPADLERRNPNLVGGDIYAGASGLDQSFLWRPLPSFGSHATPVDRLYQCGASTFPGPGLNASSGRIVARRLLGARRLRGR